jgi:hypothetical protein
MIQEKTVYWTVPRVGFPQVDVTVTALEGHEGEFVHLMEYNKEGTEHVYFSLDDFLAIADRIREDVGR